ncbi:MAG: hypothetical protein GDA65_03935 [Nitrospira sp. CR1.1]|jgi:hypothetical protein|nr:hypothetical protein [Nitrospira sp. CR1.1]
MIFSQTRIVLGILAAAVMLLPFAEGLLKNGLLAIPLLMPVIWFLGASRTRAYADRALLLLVSLSLSLTVCDLVLRPLIGSRLHYSPMNRHQCRLPVLPILGRWDAMVDFSGSIYGDLAAMIGDPAFREPRTIEFRTDAQGFRNDAIPTPVEALVLGDSFAAGAGITQHGTFAHALAVRHGLSVYNLAYPGGPYDQYVNFSIETPKLLVAPGAELIWTLFTGNDLDDAGGETWDLAALPWRNGVSAALVEYRTFRNRSPLRQLWEALQSRWSGGARQVTVGSLPDGRPMLFYNPHEVWGERTPVEVEQHPNFPKLRRTLQAMKEATDRMGLRTTIVILPTKGEVYRWVLAPRSPDDGSRSSGFAQAVIAACQQISLRCWDSKPYLVEEAKRLFSTSRELLWWRDDTHLNDRGHRAVASFVEQEIWKKAGSGLW